MRLTATTDRHSGIVRGLPPPPPSTAVYISYTTFPAHAALQQENNRSRFFICQKKRSESSAHVLPCGLEKTIHILQEYGRPWALQRCDRSTGILYMKAFLTADEHHKHKTHTCNMCKTFFWEINAENIYLGISSVTIREDLLVYTFKIKVKILHLHLIFYIINQMLLRIHLRVAIKCGVWILVCSAHWFMQL